MTPTTLDPAHTGVSCTLSAGNLGLQLGFQNSSRATNPYNGTQVVYWEWRRTSDAAGPAAFPAPGVALASDVFTGAGIVGYDANASINGNAYSSNGFATFVTAHGGALTPIAQPGNDFGGAQAFPLAIGNLVDLNAGTWDMYSVRTDTGAYNHVLQITGIAGPFYPAMGGGANGATLEAYLANFGATPFGISAIPGGGVSYDSALGLGSTGNFFALL